MVTVAHERQYSLAKILFLWLLVTAPMGLARFWIVPHFKDQISIQPGLFYWWLMIAGMIWQFVLSVIILKLELNTLNWSSLKTRLWLNHPIDPNSRRVMKRIYWLTIPIILYEHLLDSFGLLNFLQEWFLRLCPSLAPPAFTLVQNLATPEFRGAWYVVGIMLVSSLFNYLLGEELFFRGVLLPKMEGVFGKWAWAANGILFATYHVHKIEWVPVFIFSSIFCAYLNQKYRSFYPGLIIHGVEFIPLFVGVTSFVAGH